MAKEFERKAIQERKENIGEGESSRMSKQLIDHEESRTHPDADRITKLLKDFRPEELGDKLTGREMIIMFFLKVKAIIPMLVSIFLIYYLSAIYIFTYWVPLVFDDWNDWSYFFYDDEDKIPGMRKLPKTFQCILAGSMIILFLLINISFYLAASTPPGSLPKEEEWTLRKDTMSMFKHRNQINNDVLSIDIDNVSQFYLFLDYEK